MSDTIPTTPSPLIYFSVPLVYDDIGENLPTNFFLLANEMQCVRSNGGDYSKAATFVSSKLRSVEKSAREDAVLACGLLGERHIVHRGLSIGQKMPLLRVDLEWHWRYRKHFTFRGLANKYYHKIIARGTTLFTTFCRAEIDRFASAYGIDRRKFVWLPHCSNIDEMPAVAGNCEYLFSGGLSDRDYPTLFRAIEGLNIRCRIGAPKTELHGLKIPENVEYLGRISPADYLVQLANAKVFVLSLDTTSDDAILGFPGIRSYVAAMRMRKCIIVNDPIGASSYITNGINGLLPPPNDHEALREAILQGWEDKQLRDSLANNAYEKSHKEFGYERYFNDLQKYAKVALEMNRA